VHFDSESTGNAVNSNSFCYNIADEGPYYDIYDGDSNTGDDNTCDVTSNWDDTDTEGCTYICTDLGGALVTEGQYTLDWETEGDADWFGQRDVYHADSQAAQSGDVEDSQNTSIYTEIYGPFNMSFYWKVSSEEGYDYLRFYIDGVEQEKISGEVDWEQKTYEIPSGHHILKWDYTKDYSFSDGDDAGWLDDVVITVPAGGCVGATKVFDCGLDQLHNVITESCTMNRSMSVTNPSFGSCFTISADDIVIDGAGYNLDGYLDEYTAFMSDDSPHNNVTIKNFYITNFYIGISAYNLTNSTITNNSIGPNLAGIILFVSNNTNISNNSINNYFYEWDEIGIAGIVMENSSNNSIMNNSIIQNFFGFEFVNSSNNSFYNNYLNNNYSVYFDTLSSDSNSWNTTKTAGTNIIGGPNIGGNYWGNSSGEGFSQICSDADKDGICDTPYNLTEELLEPKGKLPAIINKTAFSQICNSTDKKIMCDKIQKLFDKNIERGEPELGNNTDYLALANYCGNSVCEQGETCSGCEQDCGVCHHGGGGGGGGGTTTSSYDIGDLTTKTGQTFTESMGTGDVTNMKFAGIAHKVTIKGLTATTATIEIASTPIITTLSVGETQKFDMDGDNFYDLSVTLSSIISGKANILFQAIREAIAQAQAPENKTGQTQQPSGNATSQNQGAAPSKSSLSYIYIAIALGAMIVFLAAMAKKKPAVVAIDSLLEEGFDSINRNEFSKSYYIYGKIKDIYPKLSEQEKKKFKDGILNYYEGIVGALITAGAITLQNGNKAKALKVYEKIKQVYAELAKEGKTKLDGKVREFKKKINGEK
jgi:parallel beta-helix repeat protein